VDRKNEQSLKPVVVVRKKAATKRAPTGPTQATPKTPSLVVKAAKAASPPQPRQPVQQPIPPQAAAPSAVAATRQRTEEEKRQAQRALREVLRARWAQACPREARKGRPLALGIQRDLAAAVPGHSHRQLGAAFKLFRYWGLVLPICRRSCTVGRTLT